MAAEVFTFRQLAAATDDFDPELLLGEGGFGRVYKGHMRTTNHVCFPSFSLCNFNRVVWYFSGLYALLFLSFSLWLWSNLIGMDCKGTENSSRKFWRLVLFTTRTLSIWLVIVPMGIKGFWFMNTCPMDLWKITFLVCPQTFCDFLYWVVLQIGKWNIQWGCGSHYCSWIQKMIVDYTYVISCKFVPLTDSNKFLKHQLSNKVPKRSRINMLEEVN